MHTQFLDLLLIFRNKLVFIITILGARLQVLKEKLQQKIKVQRAEQRKIQESQRKLDNEELSEEEEEEEITDEEGLINNKAVVWVNFGILCMFDLLANIFKFFLKKKRFPTV